MKKRKTYGISVIDKTYSNTIADETKFYTSDTALELGFVLKEIEYNFESAEIVLLNIDDRSLVTRQVTKVLNSFAYELEDDIIAHYGEWRGQLRFEQAGEIYVSSPVKFRIENDLSNDRPPQLSDVQSWVSLKRYADGLVDDIDELQANYQELLETGVLQTNINEKLEALEEYAPRLNDLTVQLHQAEQELSSQLAQIEQYKANKDDLANTNKQLEVLKKDFNESYYAYETLPPDYFEFGNVVGNIPQPPHPARVRTKSPIKLKAGTEIRFNKDPSIFRYGISISDLDDVWRGRDYGWLRSESFVIEEDSLVRLNLKYADDRRMTSSEFDSIVDAPFDVSNSLSDRVEYLEKSSRSNELDENKKIAINSISVEFGRVNGASYTFVRIPKFLNNGKQITPKVDLTSVDKSLAGTKNSALNYSRINDSIFTVNAGLFNISTREPVGQTIINGVSLVDAPMESDNGVPIHPDECYPIAINEEGDLTTYPRNVTTAEMLSDGIKYAVTGWGRLVENFVIDRESIENEIVHGKYSYIRQSIGQYQNGDYCVCTVDMTRGPVTNEAGLRYEELAQIFVDKGVKFAYSLDGGGSAQTVLGKRQLNPLYEGSDGRRVPTVITFDIV